MAPVEIEVGRQYESLWDEIRAAGYVRVRVDGQTHSLDKPPEIDRRRRHQVEVVIDRIVVRANSRSRIADSVENALALGRGVLHVAGGQRTTPRAALAGPGAQPAHGLRPLRAQFRAVDAAPLLVQQPAGLVRVVPGAWGADRRQSGGAAARSRVDAGQGAMAPVARPWITSLSRRMLDALAAGCGCRWTSRSSN
jgi:hypothetical protein